MNREDLSQLEELYCIEMPDFSEPAFDDNQRTVYELRYSRKDENGNPSESPRQTIWRVASNVAIVEALYAGESKLGPSEDGRASQVERAGLPFPVATAVRQYNYLLRTGRVTNSFFALLQAGRQAWLDRATQYAELIASLKFLPNTPTWSGAGTELGQLAACFVLPISDDMGRGRSSIFETLKVAALIQQTGGGNGFSFSPLRPDGSLVHRSRGKATGPVGFINVYNAAFDVISQGGTRRGANMGVLRVSHPDIVKFVEAKTTEGEVANFNLSVAIEDDFMAAVEAGEQWQLVHDSKSCAQIDARELYDQIIAGAWRNGEPGNLFIDRANQSNPHPSHYSLEATNPCGEQWLGDYENCCLGSINLSAFVDWDNGVDWDGLRRAIELSTRFLDNVVDANAYVDEVPELEEAAQGARRIGLGGMGLHDAMLKLGVRYGDTDGLDFASQMIEFIRFHTMRTSVALASARGAFPWISDSIYDPVLIQKHGLGGDYSVRRDDQIINAKLWDIPKALVDHTIDFGRPDCDWQTIAEGVSDHGIRNSAQLTFAPTGTISTVAGCEGYGCEPIFSLNYRRNVKAEGQDIQLSYLSDILATALDRAGVSEELRGQILADIEQAQYGSCAQIDAIPAHIRHAFVVTADITPDQHVWTQAVLQAFVDNSISKTVNLPNEATPADVARVYRLAYDLGCKGITAYRQGSREEEVLTSSSAVQTQQIDSEHWPRVMPMEIPDEAYDYDIGLVSRTVGVNTPVGRMWVNITEHPDHDERPFDLRITIGKAGNDKQADLEAIGRLVSLALRAGIDVAEVVDQLIGIGGYSQIGFGEKKVLSAPDGLAKLLERRYLNGQASQNGSTAAAMPAASSYNTALELCPKCKRHTVVVDQGCRHCDLRHGGCGQYNACD